MKDYAKIARLMKSDWDRRISHDYRFWMSDGYRDDEAMWESGERDFQIITEGIQQPEQKSILDLGCGVGRLLKAAVRRYRHVVGLDVSEKAVERAGKFLGENPALTLMVGNGYDLREFPDASLDVVLSFAALTSVPTDIACNYLKEINRVLKAEGVFRLQLYVGEEQMVEATDTLHLRCYREENFRRAAEAAGFAVEWVKELILPFKVSFEEIGVVASIASLRKVKVTETPAEAISVLLLPSGEMQTTRPAEEPSGSDLEGWMALKYAEELAKSGDAARAAETLEYVERYCRNITIDTSDLLGRIISTIDQKPKSPVVQVPPAPSSPVASSELYEKNLRALRDKFPKVAQLLEGTQPSGNGEIETIQTADGPVIFFRGQCLDHPQKPASGAAQWVKRTLSEKRIHDAKGVLIYGFGAGYHVEAFLGADARKIAALEPDVEVFRTALATRDLTALFPRLSALHIGPSIDDEVLDGTSELAVRPQSQAAQPKHCAEVRAQFYGSRGLNLLQPKIAVMGPLMGGTLPIAYYTSKALVDLKQRQRLYDMSGYKPGYDLFDQFIFDKVRQVQVQGQYVEMLSQLILDSVSEKPIDILICMALAPINFRALTELRKRGVITVLWFVEDYLRFTHWQSCAKYFDFIFTIQKGPCIDALKAAGAGEVPYLPVGFDPILHAPQTLTPQERERWGSPISFVGAGYHNRQQTFASLSGLPFKIWGTEWPECRPFDRMVQEKGRRLAPEEYVKIFAATDINLNLHSSTERDGVDPTGDFINPRTFELAGCGAFQLVDERSLMTELFEPGKELITFSSTNDLKDKIGYYLNRPAERRQIADRARERALREHTYVQRLRQMLSMIYSSKFEELKRRADSSAWGRMLKRAEPHPELSQRCQAAFERGDEPNLDGLVADVIAGKGKLTETEQKLMFLHHVRKQIIRMAVEEGRLKQ